MKVHHVALRTRKLARVVRFYRDVIGLRVLRETPRGVWLAMGGGAILMIERAEKNEPEIPRGTKEFLCFGVRTKRDVSRFKARVRVEDETEFTVYFRDPDGRRVGISCY